MRYILLVLIVLSTACELNTFKRGSQDVAGKLGLKAHADSQRLKNFVLPSNSHFLFSWDNATYPELKAKINQALLQASQQYFNQASISGASNAQNSWRQYDFHWHVSAWVWDEHLKNWMPFDRPQLQVPDYKKEDRQKKDKQTTQKASKKEAEQNPKTANKTVEASGWRTQRIKERSMPDVSPERYYARLMLKLYDKNNKQLLDTFVINTSTRWWGDRALLLNNDVLFAEINHLMAQLSGREYKSF